MKKKTLLSWSSGKDSAWALHVLRRQQDVEVMGLFCTFNKKYERGAMHAVRNELICRQAESIGLPLQLIPIPDPCSDSEYKTIMANFIAQVKSQGIDSIAFGDLFLEEIRSYREESLAGTGITPLFPLWGRPTRVLSKEMVNSGLRAKITCIDPKHLPPDFAGHEYDNTFLEQISDSIDPCGENGEFHSFAYDGPMFRSKLNICVGETVTRDGFVYTDILAG
ncbi:MAG: ATP-binding protein [Desulfobacterales bacterium SG8_35]|nr:MAG: ATP-binding protein [Desulfobacterales bacterium SG8_35]